MWNLLKILNKDRCLPSLNNINEVYDKTADVIEEIIYHHNYKESFMNKKLIEKKTILNYFSSSSGTSDNEDN